MARGMGFLGPVVSVVVVAVAIVVVAADVAAAPTATTAAVGVELVVAVAAPFVGYLWRVR